jgi:hypothetical protein
LRDAGEGLVELGADLLHVDGVEVEHHPVVGLDRGDVVNDRDE